MKKEWQEYCKDIKRYLFYIPLGGLMGLIPKLLTTKSFSINGSVFLWVITHFGFGLLIATMVWLVVSLEFGILVAIHSHYPFVFPITKGKRMFIAIIGACLGAFLGIWFANKSFGMLLNIPIPSPYLLPSLIIGTVIIVFFVLLDAYQFARQDAKELRALMAENRYEILKEQMQPHFLFNSLNSLAELIESGHESAVEVVYKLSNLYRQILVNSNSKTVMLEKEIEIARNYLELEKIRFGSRLEFEIKVPKDFNKLHVPSLSLQPLLENAVKHALSKTDKTVCINIEVNKLKSGMYSLSVSNFNPLSENTRLSGTGTGLSNLRNRLELLYGKPAKLEFFENEECFTVCFSFSGEKID